MLGACRGLCASCARANPPTDDHGPGPWRGLLTSEIVSNLKVHALWRNARACALRSGRRTSVRCQHLLAARKCSRKLNWTAIPAGCQGRAPGLARCAKCRPSALLTHIQTGSRSGRNPSAVLGEYITWVLAKQYEGARLQLPARGCRCEIPLRVNMFVKISTGSDPESRSSEGVHSRWGQRLPDVTNRCPAL